MINLHNIFSYVQIHNVFNKNPKRFVVIKTNNQTKNCLTDLKCCKFTELCRCYINPKEDPEIMCHSASSCSTPYKIVQPN